MRKLVFGLIGFCFLIVTACEERKYEQREVQIPDFNFPETVVFEEQLSAYNLFEGTPADLIPSADVELLELSAILFTDYAHKQRLIKLPSGTKVTKLEDDSLVFPDGAILAKTFYYYADERDRSLGKTIIETRLLIKSLGVWNVATYLWNEAQTDATLALDGYDTPTNWIDAEGNSQFTLYHVPTKNECISCHQSSSQLRFLGPSLPNLNRTVERNGNELNQISYLQSINLLEDFRIEDLPKLPDYNDPTVSVSERGRAYLAINCAHCHHPEAWAKPAERDLDFRFDTPLRESGIQYEHHKIAEAMITGEMPFVGTTIVDEAGVALVLEFIDSL